MKHTFTIGLSLVALLTGTPAVAQPASDAVYLVTIRPEAAVDRIDSVGEDLARTYGGTVVEIRAAEDTVLMRLPPARMSTIARDPRITSIVEPNSSPNRINRIAGDVAEVVPWRTGVSYSYDGAGNVTATGSDRFVYDVASRLVQSSVNGVTRTYEYDSFGNRTKCMQGTTDCQQHTINAANNRINGSNNHDSAGNVTKLDGHEYTYDAVNMQTRDVDTVSGVTREYVYTADDERIALYTVNQWWRWTIRDTSGKVLREYMSEDGDAGKGTDKWQWAKDYVWRDGVLLATRQKPPGSNGGVTYHYHVDHLGTPRRITDPSDRIVGFHDYFAFGPETGTGKSEPSLSLFKYTAHERDIRESSTSPPLDYMMARYYSATAARFLSQDPVLDVKRSLKTPQLWNRYAYVANNPLRFVDPRGEYRCTGWSSECEDFERGLMILRAAAAEAARAKRPGATRLADLVTFFGKRGEDNGVQVNFGTIKTRGGGLSPAMGTTFDAKTSVVTVIVDRAHYASDSDNYFLMAVRQAHEGDHGLQFRADPSRATSLSRRMLMSGEVSAYRTQAYVHNALGINDTYSQLWTEEKGFDPTEIATWAIHSVAITCVSAPCKP